MGLSDNKKTNFGLFSFLIEQDEERRKKESEKEMDAFGLEDWQKEEVKKDNYDSWNFDEEDPEEDDYYFGDDE